MRRPSSQMFRMRSPVRSAWWAMLATKPNSSPPEKTGATTLMSGRCVPPPEYGSLTTNMSPAASALGG